MNQETIKRVYKNRLPKKPLLQIDKILYLDEHSIATVKCISEGDFFLQGHFRHLSIFPGFLLYESIIQAASILCDTDYPDFKFSEVSTRFLSMVRPGDKVEFTVNRLKDKKKNCYKITGNGFVEGRKVISLKALLK